MKRWEWGLAGAVALVAATLTALPVIDRFTAKRSRLAMPEVAPEDLSFGTQGPRPELLLEPEPEVGPPEQDSTDRLAFEEPPEPAEPSEPAESPAPVLSWPDATVPPGNDPDVTSPAPSLDEVEAFPAIQPPEESARQ